MVPRRRLRLSGRKTHPGLAMSHPDSCRERSTSPKETVRRSVACPLPTPCPHKHTLASLTSFCTLVVEAGVMTRRIAVRAA